jgi:hypothetical protein
MSSRKYHTIKSPIGSDYGEYPNLYLGRSESRVYCGLAEYGTLWVWFLVESHCEMEWVLRHHNDLKSMLQPQNHIGRCDPPWVLYNVNTYEVEIDEGLVYGEMLEYDPDSGTLVDGGVHLSRQYIRYISILGFHPFKEIVYLSRECKRGLAYHLNTCKIEDIGSLCPPCYEDATDKSYVEASFPYTPCLVGRFPEMVHLQN